MTMSQAIKMNRNLGSHFFDKDTMDFFNSQIESKLYDNKYFITSERYDYDWPKKYTIREFDDNFFKVNDIGEFQEFNTFDDAMNTLREIMWEKKYV